MRSSKWHAHGNVYVLVEPDEPLDEERAREHARGTDGVLEVVAIDDAEAEIVVWNPDGSRAELSGNGTRIAAAWLAQRTGAAAVRIRVSGRTVDARLLADGRIEQHLGDVTVFPAETVADLSVTPVSVGNPHAVVVGDPDSITEVGPLLETHSRFPQRTNVQVARVDAPGRVTARVWERGVGETRSSGTSAVAVAAATHGEGNVCVTFPGGTLDVRLERGQASLTGPAERVE
jgi:diaminopimelate epimerase